MRFLTLFLALFLATTIQGCAKINASLEAPQNGVSDYKENAHSESDELNADKVGSNTITTIHYKYHTFEQALQSATDIIKGTCTNVVRDGTSLQYEFLVTERYLGENIDTTVVVTVPDYYISVNGTGLHFHCQSQAYNIGSSYFLVLECHKNVYLKNDRYIQVGANIFLPAYDLSQASIYGQPFAEHADISFLEALKTEEKLATYFQDYDGGNNPLYYGIEYIESDDIKEIMAVSEFVLKVKVEKMRSSGKYDLYECTVLSCLKGNVDINSNVEIFYPKNATIEGEEHIVALYEIDELIRPRSFVFSSQNSIFDISQQELITDILTELIN